jgi:hypothetical protein
LWSCQHCRIHSTAREKLACEEVSPDAAEGLSEATPIYFEGDSLSALQINFDVFIKELKTR